jgi:hypothetical protein
MAGPRILVIYYSRSGATRKAEVLSEALICDLEEIVEDTSREGPQLPPAACCDPPHESLLWPWSPDFNSIGPVGNAGVPFDIPNYPICRITPGDADERVLVAEHGGSTYHRLTIKCKTGLSPCANVIPITRERDSRCSIKSDFSTKSRLSGKGVNARRRRQFQTAPRPARPNLLAQNTSKQRSEQPAPMHIRRALTISSRKDLADQRVTRFICSYKLDEKHQVRSIDDPRIGVADML